MQTQQHRSPPIPPPERAPYNNKTNIFSSLLTKTDILTGTRTAVCSIQWKYMSRAGLGSAEGGGGGVA
jgi:hypothetical protein